MSESLDRLTAAFAGRYEIEREIGSGGMATVYLARDVKHDRQVAVKVLRPELASAMGLDRFPREISIIAGLSHPHILPLHDSGEIDGFLFYVMPYVDGESLRQKLKREGELPIANAVRILQEVVDALAYAHSHGIVHRDIKPDNVMLSGRHARVTDFGVAKALSELGGEQLTTVGLALGTPAYMSPEQATGELNIDHRSDLYSVGALAYEMLTGRPPFEGRTAQAVLSAQLVKAPVEITEIRDTVPPELARLVMRCLEKKPADRWQSAEEMLPLLETAATPSGGMTPTDMSPLERPKAGGMKRVLVGAAAVVVLGLAAFGGWMAFGGGGGGIERVAVLPLTNLSGAEEESFVTAMHDALITELGRLNVFTVASRNAVLRYQSTDKTTREIARELGVDAIMEGTVLRAGDRVRINVQLVDLDDRHVWIQSYEREWGDMLALQSDVVGTIAEELREALAAPDTDLGLLLQDARVLRAALVPTLTGQR